MRTIFCVVVMVFALGLQAQTITGFPSLLIKADSRGMAMGDGGVASAAGTQQLLYNPAKTAFNHYFHEMSVGYMPWLTDISQDTRMLNAAYVGTAGNAAWGACLNYLRLGQMDTRDDNGATLASYTAREYNLGGSFAIKLNEQHALSTTMKFLGQNAWLPNPQNIYTICGDIGYYGFASLNDAANKFEWGATITNLGAKKFNLPATASLGFGYLRQNDNSSLAVSLDLSRLLDDQWKGMRYQAGVEYGYDEQLFLRGGISFEHSQSGNRKFISLGAGYKGFVSDQGWHIDLHYLVPFGAAGGVSTFRNGWGLTLGVQIGDTL